MPRRRVVQVTADSPLVEPDLIDRSVRHHSAVRPDHTCAQLATEFPVGPGTEVVSVSALRRAWRKGTTPEDREHVTWYIVAHQNEFTIEFAGDDRRPDVHGRADGGLASGRRCPRRPGMLLIRAFRIIAERADT